MESTTQKVFYFHSLFSLRLLIAHSRHAALDSTASQQKHKAKGKGQGADADADPEAEAADAAEVDSETGEEAMDGESVQRRLAKRLTARSEAKAFLNTQMEELYKLDFEDIVRSSLSFGRSSLSFGVCA